MSAEQLLMVGSVTSTTVTVKERDEARKLLTLACACINQDGVVSNRIRVKATQRIRPDTVYMVYGFGHTNPALKSAYQRGASVAGLTTKYKTDPLMGGTSIHSNFVTFMVET